MRRWQVFFDDSARNIAAGKAAGFHTVVVSSFLVCVSANVFHSANAAPVEA
jgi:beta-phosphoglucomutase-like phosphatase (HAD superfamily)